LEDLKARFFEPFLNFALQFLQATYRQFVVVFAKNVFLLCEYIGYITILCTVCSGVCSN